MQFSNAVTKIRIGLRVAGAILGGYLLTALTIICMSAAMTRMGMARSEAVVLANMLGFVVYLLLLLWAFSVERVRWIWAAVACGAAAMSGVLLLVR